MIISLRILVAILVTSVSVSAAEPERGVVNAGSVTELQKLVLAEVPEGWLISRSPDQMVLTLRGARFLNSINPPLGKLEDLWKDDHISWIADYTITIRAVHGLTQQDYEVLLAAREQLRKSRAAKIPDYTARHRLGDEYLVQSLIPLPLCRVGQSAIWISANDRNGNHWVKPEAAGNLYRRLIEVLLSKGTKYEPEKQGGEAR